MAMVFTLSTITEQSNKDAIVEAQQEWGHFNKRGAKTENTADSVSITYHFAYFDNRPKKTFFTFYYLDVVYIYIFRCELQCKRH